MSSIMELIGPALFELSAFEFEDLPNLTVFTLPSEILTNQYQTRMSSIMGQIELEHPELFPLEFEERVNLTSFTLMDLIGPELPELFALEHARIAESDFVYTLAYTNVDQLVPNMVTMYMTMRS